MTITDEEKQYMKQRAIELFTTSKVAVFEEELNFGEESFYFTQTNLHESYVFVKYGEYEKGEVFSLDRPDESIEYLEHIKQIIEKGMEDRGGAILFLVHAPFEEFECHEYLTLSDLNFAGFDSAFRASSRFSILEQTLELPMPFRILTNKDELSETLQWAEESLGGDCYVTDKNSNSLLSAHKYIWMTK